MLIWMFFVLIDGISVGHPSNFMGTVNGRVNSFLYLEVSSVVVGWVGARW